MVFDKTGTLTKGVFQVLETAPEGMDGQTLLVPGFAPDALAPLCRFLQERLKF